MDRSTNGLTSLPLLDAPDIKHQLKNALLDRTAGPIIIRAVFFDNLHAVSVAPNRHFFSSMRPDPLWVPDPLIDFILRIDAARIKALSQAPDFGLFQYLNPSLFRFSPGSESTSYPVSTDHVPEPEVEQDIHLIAGQPAGLLLTFRILLRAC